MFASNTSQASDATFIEDVFSTYLYTGNGSTQTITNGIDLAGKGGLVWIKSRSPNTFGHFLFDTTRGANNSLQTEQNIPQTALTGALTAFNSDGFTIGNNVRVNTINNTYASWTFRDQPKFFDVVSYTGNGANRTIAHNLGSVPGCIIVKRTDTTADWQVYHRSLANTEYVVLNTGAGKATGTTRWNSTTPTSTVFSLGTDTTVNDSGGTYVAYLFAHNAGGFGLTGTDNVISCGTFTTNASGNATVNLGYEPQFCILKLASGAEFWTVVDSMRNFNISGSSPLMPNDASTEYGTSIYSLNSTGFNTTGAQINGTYIYIAIRRGPMKTPTSGTSVFSPLAYSGTGSPQLLSAGFPMDVFLDIGRNSTAGSALNGYQWPLFTRLLGNANALETTNTDPWAGGWGDGYLRFDNNLGTQLTTSTSYMNSSGATYISYQFLRAPGFFDVACYTGTGANRTVTHNLGVVPELMIVKRRDTTGDWWVYDAATGNTKYQVLNSTATPVTSATAWNNTTPTSSVFTVGTGTPVNASGGTYIAYLFASCPGVSKVGTYTGNGTNQTINCGFTGGARFILIKRTDSTGDWYVWDTARGIVTGNDPRLSLNSTAAEVTTDDTIDPANSGFIVNQLAATNVNVNAATYIYLAIA